MNSLDVEVEGVNLFGVDALGVNDVGVNAFGVIGVDASGLAYEDEGTGDASGTGTASTAGKGCAKSFEFSSRSTSDPGLKQHSFRITSPPV